MEPLEEKKTHPKRARILLQITGLFLLIALTCFLYWWIWARFNEYTDDAYVSGNLIYITPQVSGIVTQIYADDTQRVRKNQLLFELDKTDFVIALEKSKANLAETIRDVAQLFIQAKQKQALILAAKAEFTKNGEDFERRASLINSGGVSAEDLSHAEAALITSYFLLISKEQDFFSSCAQIEGTTVENHPKVLKAMEELKNAWVQLKRCTLRAPTDGLLAQRSAQVGQRVNPAEPLLAIIPLDQMWVEANFKEDQIGKMQIGQMANITTDTYGTSVPFQGKIVGIGGGTGSVFSVLPPQNATGNWIKIVQRVPVRIQLKEEEIKINPLRLGLSLEVTVDIHSIKASAIPSIAPEASLYETNIFANEENGVRELIESILLANLPGVKEDKEAP